MHRDIKPASCTMCLGPQGTRLELKLADFGNSVVATGVPPVPGVSFLLRWATTAVSCALELFSDHHTFKGDVWSIGVTGFGAHGDGLARCVSRCCQGPRKPRVDDDIVAGHTPA